MNNTLTPKTRGTDVVVSPPAPVLKKRPRLANQTSLQHAPVAGSVRGPSQPRKPAGAYHVRDGSLFRARGWCAAAARGVDIYDHENRLFATMRDHELYDADGRKMMSIRGDTIRDASDEAVGTVTAARQSLIGEGDELLIAAFWYCFVR